MSTVSTLDQLTLDPPGPGSWRGRLRRDPDASRRGAHQPKGLRHERLFVIVITAFVMTVDFGSASAPARATNGSGSSVITCPSYKPYLRVNAFGTPFCSAYP